MREVVWSMIAGNPNIKFGDKPSNKQQIMKLRIDDVTDDKPKKVAINKLEKKLKS